MASYYRTESRSFRERGEIAPCSRPLPKTSQFSSEVQAAHKTAFDEYRPSGMPPRSSALFLFEDLEDAKEFLRSEDSVDAQIYKVRPKGEFHRGDWSWAGRVARTLQLQEADGLSRGRSLKLHVESYWAGKENPEGEETRWETLCVSAIVEAIVMDRRECEAHRVTQGWLKKNRLS